MSGLPALSPFIVHIRTLRCNYGKKLYKRIIWFLNNSNRTLCRGSKRENDFRLLYRHKDWNLKRKVTIRMGFNWRTDLSGLLWRFPSSLSRNTARVSLCIGQFVHVPSGRTIHGPANATCSNRHQRRRHKPILTQGSCAQFTGYIMEVLIRHLIMGKSVIHTVFRES